MSRAAPLTIGIDARAAADVDAGRGRVVRELLRTCSANAAADERYVLYARRRWPQPLGERFRWHLIEAPEPWWHLAAARAAGRSCDVFLATNSYLPALLLRRVPVVTLVHDLLTFDAAMRPNRRSALIERLTLGRAVSRSAAMLAVSNATADDLARRFPRSSGRTVVAHLGVTPAFSQPLHAQESNSLPAPGFVLAVGTLEPRKNLTGLVAAYRSLEQETQRRHPLVVAGSLGWDTGETLGALRALGSRCSMLGHVTDPVLAELYRRCAAFCYPSLGEGFGLPVLEAMAAGAAVVTSRVSSLPEVGGDAVEYVDPRDPSSIADGLRRVLGDPQRRSALGECARARAREFSWERFAAVTLDTLERAAHGSR